MSRDHCQPSEIFDEAQTLRRARIAIERQHWHEAAELYFALACHAPGAIDYRATLAYVRGQEALDHGDLERAREQWRRALVLQPTYQEAARALSRRRRPSWFGSLFARQ